MPSPQIEQAAASVRTEQDVRSARASNFTMLDVIRASAPVVARTFKLVDEESGEEIALPAKRRCWDGYEITIAEIRPGARGNQGLIRTTLNEVFVPSVCGAKIVEFPISAGDAAKAAVHT